MKILSFGIIANLFALLSSACSAETFDPDKAFALQSASQARITTSVGINSPISGNLTAADNSSSAYIPNLGEATHTKLRVIFVRSNSLSGEINHSGMLVSNDSVHSSIYVPMQGVNTALSLVGTAIQSKLADSLVTLVQAISLLARREVNTELSYAVPINSYSRVDSSIIYRLHPDSNSGNSEFMARVGYNSRF